MAVKEARLFNHDVNQSSEAFRVSSSTTRGHVRRLFDTQTLSGLLQLFGLLSIVLAVDDVEIVLYAVVS